MPARERCLFATLALALSCAAGAASAPEGGPAAGPAPTVVLISLDGVRHDHPDRGALPALARMAREGVRAERLEPVTPASTFPAHVSLATGTHPDVHGIVDNEFWDRARGERFDYSDDAGWIEAEPLWVAAERQGVAAAVLFWVGSATDWNGRGARRRVVPFDSGLGEGAKVERILAWLDLPEAERPRLVMSWWHGADRAGHREGPDDPEVLRALADQDEHLGALLAGLDARAAWEHTTLLVVSDHGMTTAERTIDLVGRLREAGVGGHLEVRSAVGHVFAEDASDLERAEAALAGVAGVLAARREALPAAVRLAHPTRSGDLVALAEPGTAFRRGGLRRLVAGRGLHGYALPHPDMAGILFALGRGAPAGVRVGSVHTIDVAPTVAGLLGIAPPRHAEGRPIPELGP